MIMNERIRVLNEVIGRLKKKGFNNIVWFFIEFLILNIVFGSTVNYGNIYSIIMEMLPFLSRELLLSSSISLIILSTSFRIIYAKYLNKNIDILEDEIIKEIRLQKKNYSKKNNNDNDYDYCKEFNYCYVDTNLNEKQKIKVLKK